MDMNHINRQILLLETDERVVALQKILKKNQENKDCMSDVLLDVLHMSFVAGFESAINSTISSFN